MRKHLNYTLHRVLKMLISPGRFLPVVKGCSDGPSPVGMQQRLQEVLGGGIMEQF